MLFNSQIFLLVFLPVALAAYYLVAKNERLRIVLLIAGSFIFYGYWDFRLIPLLVFSVVANWLFARAFHSRSRPYLVPVGIALNLFIIGLFKYANFFADMIADIANWQHSPWSIALPLGISFFTFQQISYLADLKRNSAPMYSFDKYVLFVTFFPQLIAGPIVRHNHIIKQFSLNPFREGMAERSARGLALFVIGLIKKVMLADNLAKISDVHFATATAGGPVDVAGAWLATAAFGFQIYFDFSGYTDMAIGLGLMFGFILPINFNVPYRALSIRDFWRRWHITLSSFLREYLYIPLGGNRHGQIRLAIALGTTMLLGGLWHGAAWTFVAWGGLHGIALAANRAWSRTGLTMHPLPAWAFTQSFVFMAWIFFRADDFKSASVMLESLIKIDGWTMQSIHTQNPWIVAIAALVALVGPSSHRFALEILRPSRSGALVVGLTLGYLILRLGDAPFSQFIYFQF